MKNIATIVHLLILMFLISSCSEGDKLEDRFIDVSNESYNSYLALLDPVTKKSKNNFNLAANSCVIEKSYSGKTLNYSFEGMPLWMHDYPKYINVDENTSLKASRTAIFYWGVNGYYLYSDPITVYQEKAPIILDVSETSIEFDGNADTKEVPVNSNVEWQATCFSDWVTLTPGKNVLEISVSPNTNGYSRTATIYLTAGYVSKSITVEQQEPNLTLTYQKIPTAQDGCTGVIKVNTVANYTVECGYSWIDYEKDANDSSLLHYTILPNYNTSSRYGYLYIKVGTQKKAVYITQEALYLTVSETSWSFENTGGSMEFDILTNDAWEIQTSDLPEWLSIKQEILAKDSVGVVTVTAQDNPSATYTRSYAIKVYAKNNNTVVRTIKITQKCKSISVDKNSLTFDGVAETKNIYIKSDGKWSAVSNDDWITVEPATGSGSDSLSITVSENPEIEARTGSVIVALDDKVLNINIYQNPKYLKVECEWPEITSVESKHQITISTNDKWTAQVRYSEGTDSSWVSLSQESGTGDCILYVTIKDNPSSFSRRAMINIKTEKLNYSVVFEQQERKLITSCNNVMFTKRGGEISFIVNTDGKFSVTKEGDWFEYKVVENNIILSTTAYSEAVRNGKIILSLTDLKEGEVSVEIPVVQYNKFVSIIVDDYDDDKLFDDNTTTKTNVSLGTYGEDKNMD